jgi:uncharacterized protein YcgI (DUF1989 family)
MINPQNRIEPQTGQAFVLPRGALLTIIDLEGEQVSDLIAFNRDNIEEWLSSGRTIDYAGTICLTTDNVLYSNRSNAMLTIVEDTVGRHDFLFAPCSPEMFERLYGYDRDHPSCFQNLVDNMAEFGIASDRIPTTFNIFMNAEMAADGTLTVRPPLSRAGDHIVFRAEMELVVGLTACSAELSNNWSFKPIGYEIRQAEASH